MPQVVVYGAGGNGREIAETIIAARAAGVDWKLLGFLDDAQESQGTKVMGLPVLGPGEWLADHPKAQPVMGLGHPCHRRTAAQKIEKLGRTWATVVDPRAVVFPSAPCPGKTRICPGRTRILLWCFRVGTHPAGRRIQGLAGLVHFNGRCGCLLTPKARTTQDVHEHECVGSISAP